MSRTVDCVIAEDEQIFRDALVKLLATQWPELKVRAVCQDGAEALEAIVEHQPAVAFLDIRMPGLTGLDVAAAVAKTSPDTHVVFVTAYHQYAVDAFEKGAVDYLLKPIEAARLESTIGRLQARLQAGSTDPDALLALVQQIKDALPKPDTAAPLVWLTASRGKESRLIMVEDVLYFQADNKYTSVVSADGESLLRTPLRDLLGRLDANQFRQIHRGAIVNLKAVASIVRDESGRGVLSIKGRPEKLIVSIGHMALFRAM